MVERPPLAELAMLGRKLGYLPTGAEADRANHLLDEASELIRDVAEKTWLNTAETAVVDVPARVERICVAAAFRAFGNPEGLTQRSIGDSSRSWDRAGVGGGELVYLTPAEEKAVKRAASGDSFVSVTLVSPYSGTLTDPAADL